MLLMLSKIRGLLKKIWYMLSCSGVQFLNIPSMRRGARVKCRAGKMYAGRHFSMNSNAYCAIMNGGILTIGDNVSINRNTIIVCHDRISIGSGCAIAPNVLIYDHDHKFGSKGIEDGFRTAPVSIGDNCWIGAGAIILRGTTIGEGSVIGAGSVVKGNIPPYSLVTGSRGLIITPLADEDKKDGSNES